MKFVGEKELTFFHQVNRELIQSVVQQEVLYYQIIAERTIRDDLYNESTRKVWSNPVRINALILYENSTEQVTMLPPDSKFNIDVYFHKQELVDRNMSPKMGDFVRFGRLLYEILNVTEPQPIAGMVDEQMMVKCPCTPARRGQFSPPDPTGTDTDSGLGLGLGQTLVNPGGE
jgi:hypothetical protein